MKLFISIITLFLISLTPATAENQSLYSDGIWQVTLSIDDTTRDLECTVFATPGEDGSWFAMSVDSDDWYKTAFAMSTAIFPKDPANTLLTVYVDQKRWDLTDGVMEAIPSSGVFYIIDTGYGTSAVTRDWINDLIKGRFLLINSSNSAGPLLYLSLAGSSAAITALDNCRQMISSR